MIRENKIVFLGDIVNRVVNNLQNTPNLQNKVPPLSEKDNFDVVPITEGKSKK